MLEIIMLLIFHRSCLECLRTPPRCGFWAFDCLSGEQCQMSNHARLWLKKARGQATGFCQCFMFPSGCWYCYLDDRKDIWCIKRPISAMHGSFLLKQVEEDSAENGS